MLFFSLAKKPEGMRRNHEVKQLGFSSETEIFCSLCDLKIHSSFIPHKNNV